MQDDEPAERAQAAGELAAANNDRAFQALVEALARERSLLVRRAAARALATARPDPWHRGDLYAAAIEVLVAALSSGDVGLGIAAAEGLGKLSRDGAAPGAASGLLAAVADPRLDDRVRRAAADVLMALSDSAKAFATVLGGLRHQEIAVRCFLLAAAARYVASYDVLKSWQRQGWFTPEKTEIVVVVNSKTEQLVAAVSQLMDHPDDNVRELASATLHTVREMLEAKRTRGVIDERMEDDFRSKPTGASEHHLPTAIEETLTVTLQETRGSTRTRGLVVEQPELRSQVGRLEPDPEEPLPRYADLNWLADEGGRLPSGHALRRGAWYRLEVAVRAKPTGAPPQGPRRPMREPRQRYDALLHVTVEGDDFEIDEPVDTLVLPPTGDSTKHACFRLRPLEERTAEHPAELRVRVYYYFNLLEEIVARAEVVGRFDDPSRPRGARPPFSLRQQRLDRAYLDLDSVQPRAMQIHVERRDDRFVLHFTFFDRHERKVELAAPAPIELTDIEDALAGVRRLWCEIAMHERFATGVEADQDEFVPMVRRLAAAGRSLWVKLFKLESGGAMAKIGRWLTEHPPEPEILVQVSLGRGASAFAFPWALLYDRPLPEMAWELPDLDGFWGMRYIIEQPPALQSPATDQPISEPHALRLEVLQWEHFRNVDRQNKLITEFERLAQKRLEVGRPPVTDARTCFERLLAGRAHILYFYAHGYTRRRGVDAKPGPELELLARGFEN
ncbi:MAG TPA: HEAT repeat domain-containing protein, partial [Thermoanaerobaculia bacterium]|nr:HEAT repeat domain-containing protein [Thermoanaerobaculia bacterium]